MRSADYGIDAPNMQRALWILGALGVALAFGYPPLGQYTVYFGAAFLASALVMFWGSKVGKLKAVERMLNEFPWTGNERVLDVGCGRGLPLISVARRLIKGRATGVDVWRDVDLANNRMERTLENISIERVGNRADVRDGDARELPFEDETFDAVVSSWAVHNIAVRSGRTQAIREMVRVLRPGGWIGILDIENTKDYVSELRALGMLSVTRKGPSFLFLIPTYQVTAWKPEPERTGEEEAAKEEAVPVIA
ncbi:MAG: class I SAM-dependent methyltransferase [Fimbriimonadaceae bacterium]|nr:class I SAM-dependent methyltransferase [Fimbriimonadaceae bacterium]